MWTRIWTFHLERKNDQHMTYFKASNSLLTKELIRLIIYIYSWCTPTDLSKLPYLKNFKTFTLFARNKDCPFLHTFIFYTNNFIIITSPINRVIVFVKSLVKSVSNGQFSPLKSNFSDNKENTPEMFNTNAQSISLSVKYLRVHVFHSHK